VTHDPVASAARAAASEFSAQQGPGLAADLEAALHARDSERAPTRFGDPVALAGLIVSIASLAWQIYSDRVKKAEKPTHEVLAREVRIAQRTRTEVTGTEEKIIEIVATEIIRASDSDN
jgi:hypothetical protein